MPTIRALRRSHGMTFSELALATGISVRTLAEIEYGMVALDSRTRRVLAEIFGLEPKYLLATTTTQPAPKRDAQHVLAFGVATTASILALAPVLQSNAPQVFSATLQGFIQNGANANNPQLALTVPTVTPTATQTPSATPSPTFTPSPTTTPSPTPSPTPIPPTPTPAFTLGVDGPHGCPLVPPSGARVVITQGYGVGSHAPAATWGAVDLAIDGDGDGYAEPGTTMGATIVATLGGVAHVFPNSWPGGNFIIINHDQSGFATAYGHLDTIAITDGQTVEAGTMIGTVGVTGMSSGPHLHYEVRTPNGNIDPAPLIGCE